MTLQEFYTLRADGKYPHRDVVVWLDDLMSPPLPRHMVVDASNIKDLDVRYFKGMDVFVYTDKYSDWLLEVLEKLKTTAAFILIALTEFGDDLGWKWTKQNGDEPL